MATASESEKTLIKIQYICVWTGISRLAVLLCLKRNIQVMSCCFCRMTQIRSFVSDAQSLNHAFISTRLAELLILGTVAEINWPPAALNLAQQWTYSQKCDPICCNLMSLYNVFFLPVEKFSVICLVCVVSTYFILILRIRLFPHWRLRAQGHFALKEFRVLTQFLTGFCNLSLGLSCVLFFYVRFANLHRKAGKPLYQLEELFSTIQFSVACQHPPM